jgi:conjugal transfer pilus assembly protein TrbC
MKLINLKIMLILAAITQMQTKAAEAISLVNELENIEKNIFSQKENVDFYMFASFGLSNSLLRQMLDYAKIYNGVIVFRGIENNSFKQTAEHIKSLSKEGEEAAIIIDPTLFKQFEVERVPAYILVKREKCPVGISCKPSYDKITGNITPKYALEKFAEKGELSLEAKVLLRSK